MTSYQRTRTQKVVIILAMLSYLCSVASGIGLYLYAAEAGIENPISASLLACILFFACVGFVLQTFGSTNLPNLGFGGDKQG